MFVVRLSPGFACSSEAAVVVIKVEPCFLLSVRFAFELTGGFPEAVKESLLAPYQSRVESAFAVFRLTSPSTVLGPFKSD